MKVKTKYLVFALLFALCGIFFLGWVAGRKKADRAKEPIISDLNEQVKRYSYKIDSLTKYAAEVDQLVAEQKEVIEQGFIERKELRSLNIKRLSEITSLKTRIQILSDSVKHNGTVIHIVDTVTNNPFSSALMLPFEYNEKTKYYHLWGGFDINGNMTHNIDMPVDLNVFTGYDKNIKGYKTVVTSTNPYFKVSEITSVKVDPKKTPAWIKFAVPAITFGLGVLVGN